MATSVDSLQIELSAQATKANDAIDRLVSKLDILTKSLGGLDGSKLVGLANGVQRLGNAMQTINSVGTADFTRLANNITKLGKIDTASINRSASAINQISKSFSGLNSLPKSAEQLVQLANGIKQFGYVSSKNAVENIPNLAAAMKQLMIELSKAPKVSQNLIDMTNALAKLSRTGASSGKAATSLSRSLNTYTSSTGRASKGTKSLASAFGKMYATYWLLFRAFRQFGKAINISSDLTEVQNVVDVTFGKYSNLVEKMSDTSIADFGMSELTVKQVSSRFQAMGTAMGFTQGKMADMSIELTKLTADMASFYNVSQEDVAKDLESIFTGMTRPLRTYGLDLTEATLKEWAMKNGMDANLDSMSQMQKTMLRYNYVLANTGAAQGDFARTADTWHNSVVRLKQSFEQLGSIVGGTLINAFKPLVKTLNEAMQHVISFAQVISNALGKIFGWKYEEGTGGIAQDFEDAEESAGGIADSTGEAAKNIKKMQAGLRAFDELKVINMPDDSKSGGSGGASAGGGALSANGGQWTKTDSILKTFQSDIDTLYKLGEKISESLIKAMQGIDWNEVYEGARNFGTGLANFLNGIFAGQNGTTLFGQVGKTIAGALNTAIYSALSFGETFDFEQFGKNIADGINNFFETFDFGALAKTINTWVNGIFKTISTAFLNIKWNKVISGFLKFVGELELIPTTIIGLKTLPKLLKAITSNAIINGFLNTAKALAGNRTALNGLITSYPRFGKAVEVARKAYANFRYGIEHGNFLTGLNQGLLTVRNNLTGLQKGAITAVAGFAEFKVVSKTLEGLIDGSENVVAGIGKIAVAAGVAGTAMYAALGPAGLVIAAITGIIAAFAGINSAMEKIEAEKFGQSVKEALSNPGGVLIEELAKNTTNAIESIGEGFTKIADKSQDMDSIKGNIEDIWLQIETVRTKMDAGVLSVEEGTEKLKSLFSDLASVVEQKFNTMQETIILGFGENGAFRKYAEAIGKDITNNTLTAIGVTEEMYDRSAELIDLMKDPKISTEQYVAYQSELLRILGKTEKLEEATKSYQDSLNKIDMSKLFKPDGGFNEDELKNVLSDVTNAVKQAESDIDDAAKQTLSYLREAYEEAKTDAKKAELQELIDLVPGAVEQAKIKTREQALSFTSDIQNNFLGKMERIIEERGKEWDKKNPMEKLWISLTKGIQSKDQYIEEGIKNFKTSYADKMSSAIESSMEEVGIKGAGYAGDAVNEISNALFDTKSYRGSGGVKLTETNLTNDWREILTGVKNAIRGTAEEVGKNTAEGIDVGITNATGHSEKKAKTFAQKILEAIKGKEGFDENSPSKATQKIGEYVAEGFDKGLNSGKSTSVSYAGNFANEIKNKFSSLQESLTSIGGNASSGLLNGIKSNANSILSYVGNFAKSISDKMKKALDIHSPSRVMFEIGDFTMEGLKRGMESLYNPILSSVDSFSRDLRIASSESISIGNAPYLNMSSYETKYNGLGVSEAEKSNAETNNLLKELISAVKNGNVITIDGRELGRTVQRENQDYFNRTGRGLFEV